MIFSNFIPGSKLDPDSVTPTGGALTANNEDINGYFSSNGGESAFDKLRRFVGVSSGKIVVCDKRESGLLYAKNSAIKKSSRKNRPYNKKQDDQYNVELPETEGDDEEKHQRCSKHHEAHQWQLSCKYTRDQVQCHSTLDDCWMVIFDKVYNITDFVYEHPGGDFILLEYAGRDATQPFLSTRHGSSAYKMLDKYWIGVLVDEELYYSNNSSYCSVYSNLSWRQNLSQPETEPVSSNSSSITSSISSITTTDDNQEMNEQTPNDSNNACSRCSTCDPEEKSQQDATTINPDDNKISSEPTIKTSPGKTTARKRASKRTSSRYVTPIPTVTVTATSTPATRIIRTRRRSRREDEIQDRDRADISVLDHQANLLKKIESLDDPNKTREQQDALVKYNDELADLMTILSL